MGKLLFLFSSVVFCCFATGCSKPEEPKPSSQWWKQTCEKCGAEWSLYHPNGGTAPPKTLEWCFQDGNYCWTGFAMIQKSIKDESAFPTAEFVSHCKKCDGCKCAFFTPSKWKDAN